MVQGSTATDARRHSAATATGLVFVAIVLLAFCVNAAVRVPCRDVCGSDLGRLYETRGIDRDHAPFIDRDLEYPPLVGLVMYAAGVPFDGSLRPSFLLNALVLAALAAITTWVLWRAYGSRVRRWVFAPPLLIEGLTNWDLLSVAPATIGLVQWEAGGAFWVGVLLGIGATAKLVPTLYVPILVASCVPFRAWRRVRDLVVGAALGVGLLAIPVYIAAPDALDFFLTFHGSRNPTWGTIWFYVLRDPAMHVWVPVGRLADIGTIITATLVIAAAVVLVVQSARARLHPLCACALATVAFIVANKVYSPQYDLWLVPFLVMIPARFKLVVHFYASSLLVFVLSAAISHVIDVPAFLYLMGAAVVYRLVMLVLLARDFVATPVPAPAFVVE
ncbi:MAG: hypothetical protein WD271_05115 [Acidimicrobiia bacterium]